MTPEVLGRKDAQRAEVDRMRSECEGLALRYRRRFAERYVQIEDRDKGGLTNLRYRFAQRYIEARRRKMERKGKPVRLIILKARRLGISTQFLSYAIEDVLFHEIFNCGIVAQDSETAADLLRRAKIMREELPWDLPVKYSNRSALEFEAPIRGRVDILSAAPGQARSAAKGRGKGYRRLHCSELAFWANAERTWLALSQMVPDQPGTDLTIESTANGKGNLFHEFFWESWEGKTDYEALFLPWYVDTELVRRVDGAREKEIKKSLDEEEKWLRKQGCSYGQLAWRRWCIVNNCNDDVELFNQEYPSRPEQAFAASGSPAFNQRHVVRCRDHIREPEFKGHLLPPSQPKWTAEAAGEHANDPLRGLDPQRFLRQDDKGPLWIWKPPEDGVTYVIGADVADESERSDPSAIQVFSLSSLEQCAEFRGRSVSPTNLGHLLYVLGYLYNQAWVMPERNAQGISTVEALKEDGYPRIVQTPSYGTWASIPGKQLGFRTTVASKPLLVNAIRAHLADEAMLLRSERLIGELEIYQLDSTGTSDRFSAPKGKTDDLVIALGLVLVARREVFEDVVAKPEKQLSNSADARWWRQFADMYRTDEESALEDEWDEFW